MASVKILYRPSSKVGQSQGSLCFRIIHQRKVKVITIASSINQSEWDSNKQVIVYPAAPLFRVKFLRELEDKIKQIANRLEQVIAELEKQGRYEISDIVCKSYLEEETNSLYHYTEKQARLLFDYGQERTARAYRTTVRQLMKFNKGEDLLLEHINITFVKDFERHMKLQNKSLNTISFYIRNLRAIYHKAIQDKFIIAKAENPFSGTFTGFQRTKKRALSLEEIALLNNLDFSQLLNNNDQKTSSALSSVDEKLYTCWRLFFFCFHARGMSFVDLAYLRKDNIRRGVISYYRKKTGQLMEVKITSTLQGIIDSFSDDVAYSPYLFPIIADIGRSSRLQYESALRLQNNKLKELSHLAGLNKSLSTHMSRHSWATLAKRENLPLWVISESLGHSNEKTTYTYLASFERSILDQANEAISAALNRTSTYPSNIRKRG
ncbi:site-specific integrase [Dysgonomonas sp. ZJ279]|uniref:site-specific integrase n=1 Tax=Dysgonomonas sp. ZJ279 TaxID=2709796 RepID=UPI0013ED3A3F|nr:site-specific integrase [Dysgonomonas sp. ZJ279]